MQSLRFELSNGKTLCVDCHNKTKLGRMPEQGGKKIVNNI